MTRGNDVSHSALEPSHHAMDALSEQVIGMLVEFVGGLEDASAARVELPDDLAAALRHPPPQQPTELPALLNMIRQAADHAVETAGPRLFGYLPGGGLFGSALADLLAKTLNRYTGVCDQRPPLGVDYPIDFAPSRASRMMSA